MDGQGQDQLPPSLAAAYTAPGEGSSYLFECDGPGAVIIMDYRCWHRGLGNESALTRPLIYARYKVVAPGEGEGANKRKSLEGGKGGEGGGGGSAEKAKRRMVPVAVPASKVAKADEAVGNGA